MNFGPRKLESVGTGEEFGERLLTSGPETPNVGEISKEARSIELDSFFLSFYFFVGWGSIPNTFCSGDLGSPPVDSPSMGPWVNSGVCGCNVAQALQCWGNLFPWPCWGASRTALFGA